MKSRRATTRRDIRKLENEDLHRGASELAREERGLILGLLFYLDEIDKRRDYGGQRSLWDYCIHELGIPESQVFLRVKATRLIREYPQAIERLRDGRLNLSTLVALRKALKSTNADVLFRKVEGKTRRQAAEIAAMTRAKVVAKSSVTPVKPEVVAVPADLAELRRAESEAVERASAQQAVPTGPLPEAFLVFGEDVRKLEPVSATQCQVTFTAPIGFQKELEELAPLLSHCVPSGDLSEIFQYAVRKLSGELRKKRGAPVEEAQQVPQETEKETEASTGPAAAPRPTPASTPEIPYWDVVATKPSGFKRVHIPDALRRQVWARDEGRCQGVLPNGKRCGSNWQCEIDHIIPVARGGPTTAENLRVLCRRCNQEAERSLFGDEFVDRRIREKSRRPEKEEADA